jgi:hypothetical protein
LAGCSAHALDAKAAVDTSPTQIRAHDFKVFLIIVADKKEG